MAGFGDYYPEALAACLAQGDDYAAMARNLIHDHRISQERMARFDAKCPRPATAIDLYNAVVNYFEGCVRTQRVPDLLDRELNEQNFVLGVHPEWSLARVIVLNRLSEVFGQARDAGIAGFLTFPRPAGQLVLQSTGRLQTAAAAWLEARLRDASVDAQLKFGAMVLNALNADYRVRAFQPAWTTSWLAFSPPTQPPMAAEPPERWLEALGVPVEAPAWVMLLRYPAKRAGLVRPTVLDAGWFPCHFPSPPASQPVMSGHPMSLDPRGADVLLPEFVHEQIEHEPADVCRIAELTRSVTSPLRPQRARHHALLCRHYSGVESWMPNPC